MSRGYLTRRLVQVVPTAAVILTLAFVMTRLIPGDPAEALAGDGATPAQIAQLRTELGLDRPLLEQLGIYAGRVLRGELGTSYTQHRPVSELILARLPPTLLLTATALTISIPAGIFLGVMAARRPYGWSDAGIGAAALVGYAFPVFWLAQVAVLGLALLLPVFPVQGMVGAGVGSSGLGRLLDIAHHLVLPAGVLAASEVALLTRLTRSGLVQEIGRQYAQAALAKGLTSDSVVWRHALPNALLPVLTVIGNRIGFLLSGAVLVEAVFAWPGLGRLLVDSAQARDYPVVLGMVILASFTIVAANLLTDLAYGRVDPRIDLR